MKKYVWVLWTTLISAVSFSQNSLRIIVKDSISKEAISNATIVINNVGKTTDNNGFAEFLNLPDGNFSMDISAVG
jgi:hypothetical protein